MPSASILTPPAIGEKGGFDFGDFAAAAAVVPPGTDGGDFLDEISTFIRWMLQCIGDVEAVLDRASAPEKSEFDAARRLFSNCCDPQDMAAAVWDEVMRKFQHVYLKGKHLELKTRREDKEEHCVELFLRKALGITTDDYRHNSDIKSWLAMWDSAKVRRHMRTTFGDEREASIQQLQKKALEYLGENGRPEAVMNVSAQIFRPSSASGFLDQCTNESDPRCGCVIDYLAFLATGKPPADAQRPSFFGFNDGAKRWEREKVYRRQKNPFAGVQWLRFTAEGKLEIALEPAILAVLVAQWDERFPPEIPVII